MTDVEPHLPKTGATLIVSPMSIVYQVINCFDHMTRFLVTVTACGRSHRLFSPFFHQLFGCWLSVAQWKHEIERHAPALDVLIYDGKRRKRQIATMEEMQSHDVRSRSA